MSSLKRGALPYRFITLLGILLLVSGMSLPQAVQAAGTTISMSNVVVLSHSCSPSYLAVEFDISINVPTSGAFANIHFRFTAPGLVLRDAISSIGIVGPGPTVSNNPGWGADGGPAANIPANTPITVTYNDTISGASSSFSVNCTTGAVTYASSAGAGAFFSPGDSRADGRPGDRLVVWCNQPDKIVVYGIAHDVPADLSGFHLVTFSYQAVQAAGPKGLTQKLGANGSVSISLIDGWFWIAWNGGKYSATGRDSFVKNFEAADWCSWG